MAEDRGPSLNPTQPLSNEPAKQIVKREREKVEKHISTVARDYDKHLRKFEKEAQDMKSMYCHYPPSTKPWRAPYDRVELDEELEGAAEGDVRLSITIPKGSTRRQAMERVCFFATATNKDIMYDSVKKHYLAMEEKIPASGSSRHATITNRNMVLPT